ncbi:DUF1492 domain-containing protein [Anaerofustis sp.]|uniref:DUF1492 domain-containing protein n=1 Tax=Anaerofustis sp. TaxID=1872517 RepID=UPI0025C289D2|nr:DUF1492 domain-containing protein [Anaerofustis sp.]
MNDYKKTEALLYNYIFLKKSIETDKLKLEELNLESFDVNASKYDTVKVDSSTISDITAQNAINHIIKKEYLARKIRKNTFQKKQIDIAMEALNDTERTIIKEKYFRLLRDYEVYDNLCLSRSNYYRIKKQAVKKVSRLIS